MGGLDDGSVERAGQDPSSSRGAERAVRNPTIRGVTLAQYAAVQAGLAEGFELAAILAREGIDARAWERASPGFAERLADDEALEFSYDVLLEGAQDRYARPLPPIDRDVRAWLDFVRRWSAHEDPARLLADCGLRPTDVIRLNRSWSKRFAAEPELAREIEIILAAEAGPLPEVSPAPATLEARAVPAPASEGELELPEDEDDDQDEEEDDEEVGVKRRPRLFVDPPGFERQDARVRQPESAAVTAPPAPERSDAGPPEPALPTFLAAASRAIQQPAPAPAASPRIAAIGATGELPADLVKRIAKGALPFARSPGPQPEPRPAPSTGLPSSRGEPERLPMSTGTTDVPRDLVQQIAKGPLPFRSEPPTDPEPTTLDGEQTPPTRPALPFGGGASSEKRHVPLSTATADIPRDLVQRIAKGTLPFQPSAPAGNAPAAAGREPPRQVLAVSAPEERTSDAQPSPINAALPFQRTPAKERVAMAAIPSAQPPAGSEATGTGPTAPAAAGRAAPVGELTLDQYASMCAELAVFSDRAEAVFAKYGLTDARRRAAVDAAWKERLSRYPSERAEWERRYWQYETSWRRSRR